MAQLQRRFTASAFLFALFVSVGLHFFILIDPLSRFEYLVVQCATDVDAIVSVYSNTGLKRPVVFSDHAVGSAILVTGGVRSLRLPLRNRISPEIRIKFNRPLTLTVHSARLLSHFAADTVLQGEDFTRRILAGKEGVTTELTAQGMVLHFTQPNGTFQIKGPLRANNTWFLYGVPALVGFLLLLLLSRISLLDIPALQDVKQRKGGGHIYRKELDGLRGLAALFVLLEHSWSNFLGLGRTGVWFFFLLSGYLLSQPFVLRPNRAVDPEYLSRYALRRVFRIIPMYFVTVMLLFGVTGHADKLLSHFLFMQADGYLWTIPQEIHFYLLLPVLMLVLYLLGRIHRGAPIAALVALCGMLLYRPGILPITIFSFGTNLPLYAGWFLSGTLLAFLNVDKIVQQYAAGFERQQRLLSLAGFVLFGLLVACSLPEITEKISGSAHVLPMVYKGTFGVACAVMFAVILLTPNTALSGFFTWLPFRAIGIVGFSFYLLHPIVIDIIRNISTVYYGKPLASGPLLFFISMLCTWLASVATYSLIERPFIRQTFRRINRQQPEARSVHGK